MLEWNKDFNKDFGIQMAHVAEFYLENGWLPERGLIALTSMFGEIPPEHRADVFTAFIEKLDELEVPYDKSQFA